MKNFSKRFGFIALVVIAGFLLATCENGSGGSSTADGAIKIVNVSSMYSISYVEILDATTGGRVFNQRANIEPKSDRTFSIAPGKYFVEVTDDEDDTFSSNQITVNAGATVTLTYNGYEDLY